MITKLAIEAYSKLHEYTKTLCLEIDNTSSIECSHVSDLSLCNSNIHTHLFLNNIRCEVVNIYQELIYSFRGNRARQKVSFYTNKITGATFVTPEYCRKSSLEWTKRWSKYALLSVRCVNITSNAEP